MNKREKEILNVQLEKEKEIVSALERQYKRAMNDIIEKTKIIQSNIDMLKASGDTDEATISMIRSKVYQKQYQNALKGQIESIIGKLHSDEYSELQGYLNGCYETGYIGTMYNLAGQGIPVLEPIDQNMVIKAVQLDSKIKGDLYESIGVDAKKLKKNITSEISRGIAEQMSYTEMARNIANRTKAPLSRVKNIVATEGHRIQEASGFDAMKVARKKGADQVKQWCSTLDGSTRDTHRQLDGQIREIDEPFEIGGRIAMYPGDFGDPAEDCNCRCTMLKRARWALDEDELQTLKDRADFFGIDKTNSFEEFKQKYIEKSTFISVDETVKITKKKGNKIYSSIDASLVNSKKYHDKFEGLTDHKPVNESIYQESMRMLEHRDGTPYEDMVILDMRSGRFVTGNLDSTLIGMTGLTEKQYQKVKEYNGKCVIVHNHPNSSRISYKDILTMYKNQNIEAVVAVGHDGSVQIVSNINRKFMLESVWEEAYNKYVQIYKDKTVAEHKATDLIYELRIFKTEIR